MSMLIRLILFFILFLTSQLGIAAMSTFTEHQYDVNHIVLSEGIYNYDTTSNLRYSHLVSLSEKTQDRSFLAFVSDLLATKSAPNITKAYKRPSGATTKAQRESVQGKPCVDCGAMTPKQFADNKDPLVKEYYRTGNIDKTRMRDLDSVQPQCPTCSSRQGAEMSRFSRQQKKGLGL